MILMKFGRLLGLRFAARALEWEGRSALSLCRRACSFNSAWFGKVGRNVGQIPLSFGLFIFPRVMAIEWLGALDSITGWAM